MLYPLSYGGSSARADRGVQDEVTGRGNGLVRRPGQRRGARVGVRWCPSPAPNSRTCRSTPVTWAPVSRPRPTTEGRGNIPEG